MMQTDFVQHCIMILQLLTWGVLAATSLAECVTWLRNDGIGNVVGYRLFSNGSLGVVDDYARLMIFDGVGSLFYKENLNLPNDPERVTSPYRISFAIIADGTNQLWLLTGNLKSFRYLAGVATMADYGDYMALMYFGMFLSFPDYGLIISYQGPSLFAIDINNELKSVGNLDIPFGSGSLLNITYMSRSSANPLLNEYYIVTLSNKTFIGSVDPVTYDYVPDTSTAASYLTTEPLYFIITTSIGGNTDYIAFAGYYPPSASGYHEHRLTVKERATGVSVSLPITDYHIWSVALDNSTATKMYFLTHDGSLYSATFSASSIDTPTLMVKDLFVRYAGLEIISSTKLLLRTIDSVAVFDIPTSTFKFVVDIKPTGGRHFGSKMFVLTHNFNVSLYEISGNLPVRDNSFNYVGKVKELIISIVYNRFYILTANALYTFSLTTYSQLASLSLAQIQTLTGATSIVSLNDIAPLALQPTKLLIVAFGSIGGDWDTVMLVLNDINLAYLTHRWTGLLDNFLSVHVDDGLIDYDIVTVCRPNFFNAFYYYASNNSIAYPLYDEPMQYVAPYNAPEIANMQDVLYLGIPSGDKQLPRTDLAAGYAHMSQVQSNMQSTMSRDSNNIILKYFMAGFINRLDMMVQRLEGNLNKTIMFSGPTNLMWVYPNLSLYSYLSGEDLIGGIGYQKSDDTFRFFRGDFEVTKVEPLECYADPTKGYQLFKAPCFVNKCKYCSSLDPYKCAVCNSGKQLKQDVSACLTTCNPAYALNGKCYADCPIEYYKYKAPYWTCDTASVCTGSSHGNKLILGDRCNSVSSCPSGSTQNASKYCTFSSTKSADSVSTFILTLPCAPNQYYFPHYSMCVSDSNPFYVNYTRDVSSMTMYCDESTHFYDIASKRCLKTCGLYKGIHPQMGLICATAANCISIGMLTDDTTSGINLCTSTCSATLWANLISKSCEAACTTPSTYSIAANRTCLSEVSCLAAVGFGLLSMVDSACVSVCGPTQYLITASKKCVSDTDCWGLSYLTALTTRLCQPTCLANEYMDNVAHYCYTKAECSNLALLTKAASPTNLCISACSAPDYLDNDQKSCVTKQECTTVSGKFVIGSNMTCVSTCPASLKFVVSGECVSSCPAGYYFEESLPDCVSKCPEAVSVINPPYCLRYLALEVKNVAQTDRDSVVVILEVYFESNSTSTVTSFSVELATLFKQVGIVTDTSMNKIEYAASIKVSLQSSKQLEIEFMPTNTPDKPFQVYILPEYDVEFEANTFRASFRNKAVIAPKEKLHPKNGVNPTDLPATAQVARSGSQMLLAATFLTPLMMSTFMGLPSGSFLCLIAQTYTKLMMLTYFNFKLEVNEYSEMYYSVFREFLDVFNEELMIKLVGSSTVQTNKQYVCQAGFDKLCYMTVEDNFFMSHLLSLIILAGQAVIVYLLALIFKCLKYTYTGDLLLTKLKNILVYAFLLENNIQFWFTLLLNALIFVYNNTVLAAMKIGGHVVFVVMLVFLGKILARRDSHYSKLIAVPAAAKGVNKAASLISHSFESVFERFRALLKEITVENRTTSYLKGYLLHDLIYSIVLIPGKHLGNYQMVAWLAVEVALFVALVVFRPFSTRALNNRQIVIEFLIVSLLLCMTLVPHLKSSNRLLSLMILILSLIILVIDILFALIEFVKVTIELVKYLIDKESPTPPSPQGQTTLISNRILSSASMRLLGKSSKTGNELRVLKESKRRSSLTTPKDSYNKLLGKLEPKISLLPASLENNPTLEPKTNFITVRPMPKIAVQNTAIKPAKNGLSPNILSGKISIKPRSIGVIANTPKAGARNSNGLLYVKTKVKTLEVGSVAFKHHLAETKAPPKVV